MKNRKRPIAAIICLGMITLASFCCELFLQKNPTYMDMYNAGRFPGHEFLFGTDHMGRDVFSMIWYGGRASLTIGVVATVISTFIAIIVGTISGLTRGVCDTAIMRATEIVLSIPELLLIVFIKAVIGGNNVLSIGVVIGLCSWPSMAKVVRTEVIRLGKTEYILASRAMGGGFTWILRKHLLPNIVPPIMFMVVMNLRGAIIAESTLSFMGLGLPLEVISWGSMLSLSERALLTGAWHVILIPGIFLVVTLLCVTDIGEFLRGDINRKHSNL